MLFRSIALAWILSNLAGAAQTVFLTDLPRNLRANLVAVDAAGNIYVAGTFCPGEVCAWPEPGNTDIFLARLTSDSGTVLYTRTLGGQSGEQVTGLAVTPDGRAFITGVTYSEDFPTTLGAWERAFRGGQGPTGFAAGFDSTGRLLYSTFIPQGVRSYPGAIAVNERGEAYVTGVGSRDGFPTTPGALNTAASTEEAPFVLKLDGAGSKALLALSGVGGGRIVLDPAGNIYVSGSTASEEYPTTPGAFQTGFVRSICGASWVNPGAPCGHQYVTKINPDGTALVFSTFVSGPGEVTAGLAVDNEGSVYLTGDSGDGYITTPGAAIPQFPSRVEPTGKGFTYARSGFVTKLNREGSALIYSTYLGGAVVDHGTAIAVNGDGNTYVSGLTTSSDFPGVAPAFFCCRTPHDPTAYPFLPEHGFIAGLNSGGSAVLGAELILATRVSIPSIALGKNGQVMAAGTRTFNPLPEIITSVGVPPDVRSYVAGVAVDVAAPGPRAACIVDSADFSIPASVVPGQLISVFGTGLGPDPGREHGQAGAGTLPTELAGVRVTFDGIAAPLLYVAASQINVVVPYEVAGPTARMELYVDGAAVDSRDLAVAPSNPGAFVNPDIFVYDCAPGLGAATQGAWNADASPNSCSRPAQAGSTATVYLNGLGNVASHPPTGAFNMVPAAPLGVPVELVNLSGPYGDRAGIVFAGAASGQVSGVWRVDVFLPEDPSQSFGTRNPAPFLFGLTVGGVRVRPEKLVVWVAR